jgi:hypothetical protein
MKKITKEEIRQARKELVQLGLLEDSGQRRPNSSGQLEVVWQLTPLGRVVSLLKAKTPKRHM